MVANTNLNKIVANFKAGQPMLYKVRIGNELYVYHRGKLIYKRWIKEGCGLVFDKYGTPFGY